MKKLAALCLICVFLLSACTPETVRQGGVVLHGDARDTSGYLSYYSNETIVYVTKSGTKYHTSDCTFLTQSAIPVSLEQAIAEGKTPCSRCHPPD